MSKRAYKTYTKEFKVEEIRLGKQSDQPMTQMARKLGLRVNQIYKWTKQLEEKHGDAFSGKQTTTDKDAKIRHFHQTSRDKYGSPRICEDLVGASSLERTQSHY